MSTTTTNYNLIKPELTDAADITAMNPNWDKIDEELKKRYSPDNKPSADDLGINLDELGAVPIKDARSSSYDMDAIFKSGRHCTWYITDSSTLGTPYAYGVIGSSEGLILSYASSSTYGSQWEFISGGLTRYRTMKDGVISEWTAPYLALSGGTLTGALNVNNTVTAQQIVQNANNYGKPSELGQYIDMHIVGSTNDFDLRLIASDSKFYTQFANNVGVNHEILHTGNSNMTALVSTDTTPTVNNAINWTYK